MSANYKQVYVRSDSEREEELRSTGFRQIMHVAAVPGGSVRADRDAIRIAPGQIVRFPAVIYATAGMHHLRWLKEVTEADFVAALEAEKAAMVAEAHGDLLAERDALKAQLDALQAPETAPEPEVVPEPIAEPEPAVEPEQAPKAKGKAKG